MGKKKPGQAVEPKGTEAKAAYPFMPPWAFQAQSPAEQERQAIHARALAAASQVVAKASLKDAERFAALLEGYAKSGVPAE